MPPIKQRINFQDIVGPNMVNKFNHLHERGVLTLSKEEEEIMGHAIPRKGSNDSSREHLIAMKSRNRFKNVNKGRQFRT